MSYLIDTNVISEVRKRERCDPAVKLWWRSVEDDALFLSALVLGEIRKGIEKARPRDPAKATALERWLEDVTTAFADRILPVDQAVADAWGRMAAQRPVPVIDALLAATAKVNGLTIVSRNAPDLENLGAAVLNPFVPRHRP